MQKWRPRARAFAHAAFCVAVLLSGEVAFPETIKLDSESFKDVLENAEAGNWAKAVSFANAISDPAASIVVEWMRLRSGVENWESYNKFLNAHGDWPGLKLLRKVGERSINRDADPKDVVQYFAPQSPQTGNGAVRLAEALTRLNYPTKARDVIVEAWLSLPFGSKAMEEALELFPGALKGLHTRRLDNLLWEGRTREAEAMIPFVNDGYGKLARARIALRTQANGVDARISSVPSELKDDPGLAFERMRWRVAKDKGDSAIELMLERSVSAESLGNPEAWSKLRRRLAHRLMRRNQNKKAYQLASSHRMGDESGIAELEWLSGFLALRKLGNSQAAINHFTRFRGAVNSPISLGRAGFWLGLAHEAAGNQRQAMDAYRMGARYQTTFYGQLAAERIGAQTIAALTGGVTVPDWRNSGLAENSVVRAALFFHTLGWESYAAWFMAHRAETLDSHKVEQLVALARAHGAEFAALKTAKQGLKQEGASIDSLFPLTGIEEQALHVPPELVKSITRQETEFKGTAVSPKGAIGLMQILPTTGKPVAKKLGLTGSIKSLLRNNETNVEIGSRYLKSRLESYGGSYIMAIASYNAGPGRLRGWLSQIGDPRDPNVNPIDWIEHIPYSETRNYVMRVMESVTVYRMRISGKTQPICLSCDLLRGRKSASSAPDERS